MSIIAEQIMIIRSAKKRIAELEQQLADETKVAGYWMKQSRKDHNRAEKAEKELSRYLGGAEVERLTIENRQLLEGLQLKSDARKQAAQEIIQYIIDQGKVAFGSLSARDYVYDIIDSDIEELRQRYGLEG